MAKFVNNTTTATVNRRVSFGFTEGAYAPKTLEEMAETISELVGYGGDYLYGGEYATVVQYPEVLFDHLCHWVRDYDRRDPQSFIAANFGRLQRLIEGSTLRIGKDAQDSSYEEWLLKDDMWVHTLSYSEQEARWAEQNLDRQVYLFSGIRAAVAAKLGMEADYGFHKSFDLAIEEIYS